ncbi:Hypothetical predicted protein [Mytilus galloprovincialis]|uniref:Endonuclease/exonuclease/phosphatase domain-containing protein n=1 Tax=Mytilus galloprovincialis TaxID=29158 RepID=A0A8B6BH14_MYTGA|nr:Hypothetical predicted protein [Mytilus galloprovincialis]
MYITSKTAQVIKEMQQYRLDILGVSECRWTGSGKTRTNTTIKLKLRKAPIENQNSKRLDTARLKSPNVKKAFCLELKNRFSVLDNSDDGEDSVQEKWDNIKDIYKNGRKDSWPQDKKNKDWLTSGTWQKNEERKTIKLKSVNAKSKRLQDQLHASNIQSKRQRG